ncbi:hypothetical protein [Streptomyces sp. NBC_01565]|uniref:hypothetical protein n=1 Tax=Streptomyces sp. NBC_01565 TaxID=2975881 RepID=UPI0022564615|nr:hypothetical protein [Streptomyces sp. NBC_01565]MCX4540420.1 hypothetical protein [Streptomyces sp. NBC_01565]
MTSPQARAYDKLLRVIINPDTEDLLHSAARNNAEWCAAVSRDGGFTEAAWTSARRTPPYYPDAVTLTRDASATALLAAVDTEAPGCSVKDSFAMLDLGPAGFEVLFEAQWIHRAAVTPAAVPAAVPSLRWTRVVTAGELVAWERAWDGEESTGLFHPGLLAPEFAFLAGHDGDGRVLAGAAAHRTGAVVGISNVFSAPGTPPDEAWTGSLAALAALWPGLPLVGYESGDDLTTATRHGFTPIGPLRVWLRGA